MMMEAIRSSEKSVLTTATRRHIREEWILQNITSSENESVYFKTRYQQ
jgi:hypothetical protein